MRERSIITLARIELFPVDHPAALMCALSDSHLEAHTWVQVIREEMKANSKGPPILDIWECKIFPRELLNKTQNDKNMEKRFTKV